MGVAATPGRRTDPPAAGGAVRVRVSATSANLGPGYDAFGLALALHDEVVVRPVARGVSVEVTGEGAESLPRDGRHLVVRSMEAALARMGRRPGGIAVSCRNRIPHGRGLGSSAAAIVAGLTAARAVVPDGRERLDDEGMLELATELEGHPDNVAACLLGGFTLAWSDPDAVRAVRLTPDPGLGAIVAIPEAEVATSAARGLLPAHVPHADAARNAARAALLVEALTRRTDLLLPATEDRLHQSYRASAMPATAQLVDRLRAEGIPAVVSGAGPTVLVLRAASAGGEVRRRVTQLAGAGFVVRELELEPAGALVTGEP